MHDTMRDLITSGTVKVDYVRTDDNMGEPLMKGLAREKVLNTTKGMRLKPIEVLVISDGYPTCRLEIPRNMFKGKNKSLMIS